MGAFVPLAPTSNNRKKYNRNLKGMGGVYNIINLNAFGYAGNNPVKLIDPNGMWIDNGDGTHTAEKGDTLWGLYGADWQAKSGYTGDPRNLQVGETVGNKKSNTERKNESARSKIIGITQNTNGFIGDIAAVAAANAKAMGGLSEFTSYHNSMGSINALWKSPANPMYAKDLRVANTVQNATLVTAFILGGVDALMVGIETGNWERAGFRLLANSAEVLVVFGTATVVTTALTAPTLGIGVVPATITGAVAGIIAGRVVNSAFREWEKEIYGD
jgi:hypothetical protein